MGIVQLQMQVKRQLNEEELINELQEAVAHKGNAEIDFKAFPLDLLADYIEKIIVMLIQNSRDYSLCTKNCKCTWR